MNKPAALTFLRYAKTLAAGRCPGQLVLQYTDRCNARCPQCGMRATEEFQRSKLSLDEARKTIDAAAARGMESLSITGGEPLLYGEEVIQLLRYARKAGIRYTRTGTNGFLFANHSQPGFEKKVSSLAEKLVDADVYSFWISIDSADPLVHEQMRGLKGVWKGIEKALPIFHRHGVYPTANLGINRRTGGHATSPSFSSLYDAFRDSFARFFSTVIDLGFTIANCCYPMDDSRDEAVYRAAASDDIVRFTSAERAEVYRALFDAIVRYRSKIRIFAPLSSLYALIAQHVSGRLDGLYPCRGGIDYFFVSAVDGNVYPCGYRGGENLGKLWDLARKSHDPHCAECDWECFRDPSELIGPLAEIATKPWRLLAKWLRDPNSRRIWATDLRYYYVCDFFNSRVPPDYVKLSKRRWDPAAGRRATSPSLAKELRAGT